MSTQYQTPDKFSDLVNKKPRARKEDFKRKFKTEMCRYYASGHCKFGDNCAFAHSRTELCQKTHLPQNYKTKKCKQFFEEGYCLYGFRC